MKVCFVVGTLGRGGAEKQLVLMLRALQRAGVETRVLCLTEGESYEAEIKSLGIEVNCVGAGKSRLERLWEITKDLRAARPDIVQSSHFYTNIYVGLAGRALRLPSIGAIRSNLASELKIHGFLGKFQLRLPAFLIANSDFGRRGAIAHGVSPDKIAFVRNAVDFIADESGGQSRAKESLTFLFVGRLGREKRPDRFVRLAAALAEKFPDRALRFQIAGDGALREEIEKKVGACPALVDKLEFLGERKDMHEIYRQADVLALTSDYEGTPNVVLEAMSHGLPVVATKVGGTPEILRAECGMMVDADDEEALIGAAGLLVENDELRAQMGAAGLRYMKNNHSLENLTAQLTEIYAGLLKSSKNDFGLKPVAEKISSR